ncbi:MAG: DNA polymerase III subunit alpha, partial [Alphaproteobacteria bacterium]|nr:DNA polymerase III subunit alpha [Alphaproteobacteria bacterium]
KGKTEDETLRDMAYKGFEMRMQGRTDEERQRYQERLDYELGIIKQMGFPGYFLIGADIIQWSKANGVPVGPGRGSGAGSVVAWCWTITNIDPLRFNLLFERFLNPERVSMPDFDVDFCQENRGKTIEYVQNHYGFDHVAQIITFGKLQAKAVIRDVGRVLQIPYPVVDRLSKLVPNELGITLKEAIEKEPEFENQARSEESIKHLLEIALKLEGLNRNSSTHAAGVVIGNKPLDQIVPIYKDPSSDMPVTQYNMKFVEDASLIKFDFLGLKTLTTIKKTADLVRLRGIEIDENDLPLDDEATFALLKSANTSGVFQLESAGMRKILHDMQPDKIEDIVALVSLYRPGPMDSIPSYIARKKGTEEPDYMHPMLEGILKETYGIMIYQEQVMQISQVMAGYTLGGADLLRRAMGKKIKEEMVRQRGIFIEGAIAKGVDQKVAETVFDKMAKFAEYGFNKSHAAAYAYIAYQTAYLKAHYPVEFMAATMTLDKINTDKLAFFKNDLDQMKIKVLPPDINKSGVDFTVENGCVRYALSAVKNVGEAGMQAVVAEREKNGPFKSIEDFAKRMDSSVLNERYIENLAKAGAFECLEKNRAKVYSNVEKIIAYSAQETQARNSSQISLFGDTVQATKFKIDDVPEWPHLEKLTMESEAIGFYLSAHPLDAFESVFERLRVSSSSDLERLVQMAGASKVSLAAIVSDVREKISQKGNKFGIISATDKGGAFEVFTFAEALATNREKLKSGQPLLLNIMADKRPDDERIRLSLIGADYLNDIMSKTAASVIITVGSAACVPALAKTIEQQPRGQSRVFIVVKTDEFDVEISLAGRYTIQGDAINHLQHMAGILDVRQV